VFIEHTLALDVDCPWDNVLDGDVVTMEGAWETRYSPQVAGRNCFWNRVFAMAV